MASMRGLNLSRALAALAVAGGLALLSAGSALAAADPLAAVPVAAPQAAAPAAIELRLSFAPGEERRYGYDMHVTYAVPGQGDMAMDMAMQLAYRVLEVHADQSATVRVTIDRAVLSLLGQTMDVPDVAGLSVRARVQPNGAVTEAALEGADGGLTGFGNPAAVEADNFARGLLMVDYPSQPLAVGDSFERQFRFNNLSMSSELMPMTLQSRLSLQELSVENGQQVARLAETVSMSLADLAGMLDLRDLGVEMSGNIAGGATHLVDVASGWPVSGDAQLAMTMVLTSPDLPESITLNAVLAAAYRLQ